MKRRLTTLALGIGLSGCPTDSCFAAGTRVETPDGPRPIEQLAVGDAVWAVDPQTGERFRTAVVAIARARREVGALSVGGRRLRLTSDHPLYCPERAVFAPAGQWLLGARTTLAVVEPEGLAVRSVDEAAVFDGLADVFDITVAHPLHTLIAEGVVAHNKTYPSEWVCPDGVSVYDYEQCPDAALPEPDMQPDAAVDPDLGVAEADMQPDAAPVYTSTLEFPVDGAGPFAVGHRTWPVDYVVPGTGEVRTIVVNAWYPARRVDGPRPRFENAFDDPDSVIDAPARPPAGESYPVLVHSHGDRGFAGNSAYLMAHFASHGWVAVAPDHAGNTLTDNPRGELVAHFVERPADISATLDALAALPADDALAAADTERVILSGHSRGTYTVWAGLGAAFDLAVIAAENPELSDGERAAFEGGLADGRVVAGIAMDGGYREGWFGPDGWRAVQLPLQMQSVPGAEKPDVQAIFDRAEGLDLVWVEVAGACHQTFGLGLCGTLEKERGFRISEVYALAFARRHLLGDDDPQTVGIVEGEVAVDAAATVTRR